MKFSINCAVIPRNSAEYMDNHAGLRTAFEGHSWSRQMRSDDAIDPQRDANRLNRIVPHEAGTTNGSYD